MKSRAGTEAPKPCPCGDGGFGDLPPEMRPRAEKRSWLRQVTCPACGLVYSTNRAADLCMTCEKEGRRPPRSEKDES